MVQLNRRYSHTLVGLLITVVTVSSFQNCAPPPESTTLSSTNGTSSSGSSTSSSSSNNRQGGSSIWGSRSSGSNSLPGNGSSGTSMGGVSNNGGLPIGGGISIGGSGGGGGGSTGSSGTIDTTFRITQQPQSLSVSEGARFQIDVSVTGGKPPYNYQWYKDNNPLGDGLGVYSLISDEALSYKKEGLYHVIVRDASGKSAQSSVARLTIVEPKVGCEMGSYFTYTSTQFDQAYGYIPEYFDGPRGKFILHRSFDAQNFLYNTDRRFSTLSTFDVPKKLEYLEKTWVACKTAIPRIHTPQYNPGSLFYGYENSDQWQYKGNIEFECRNRKLKLLANTCKWEVNPNYVPPE